MIAERLDVPADLETPVSAFLKLRSHGARFLLESAEQGERLGRYTFIGLDPWETIRIEPGRLVRDGQTVPAERPLESLRSILSAERIEGGVLPGPVGGAVGYFSYDFARTIERLPARPPDPLGLPLAAFVRCATTVVFDHLRRRMTLVGLRGGRARLAEVASLLRRPLELPAGPAPGPQAFEEAFPKPRFLKAVADIQEHIRAGDIFQGVLSRRASCELSGDPFAAYRALRMLNPSPYMFFLDFGDHQLVGSSPEVHAKVTGRRALVRPIAGTRPRGASPAEDLAIEKDLLADPKERAEHLMLIDLARNDVGRVCEYGSVILGDLFAVERYSHVMHIVSQVEGTLRPDADAFDLLGSSFPAGTVTGAPKIRAMQILDGLEPVARGPYAGAAGYFSLTGDMDFCISIRTLVVKGGRAHLQAGAGIVLDSDPGNEWRETERKMQVLKDALEAAGREFAT